MTMGPGEERPVGDVEHEGGPETSEIGWDLEMGSLDDPGDGDEDFGAFDPNVEPGPASLGSPNDPIESYVDDFPASEEAA